MASSQPLPVRGGPMTATSRLSTATACVVSAMVFSYSGSCALGISTVTVWSMRSGTSVSDATVASIHTVAFCPGPSSSPPPSVAPATRITLFRSSPSSSCSTVPPLLASTAWIFTFDGDPLVSCSS
ncbi:hypothetical protein ACFPRL_13935 [Pseudoclavibacter helvolus]